MLMTPFLELHFFQILVGLLAPQRVRLLLEALPVDGVLERLIGAALGDIVIEVPVDVGVDDGAQQDAELVSVPLVDGLGDPVADIVAVVRNESRYGVNQSTISSFSRRCRSLMLA